MFTPEQLKHVSETDQAKKLPSHEKLIRGKLFELRIAQRKCIGSGVFGRKNRRTIINVCRRLHGLIRSIYRERLTEVCVPIRPVTALIRSAAIPMRSVTVHMARRGFQDCVVYCLLPPTLVYFAVLQPGLFSVCCLIDCTTTKTTLSELPHALC